MVLVHVHDDVFNALVVPLVGGGDGLDDLVHHEGLGDIALLFQHGQGGEDLRAVHAGGLFLLFASHGLFSFIQFQYGFFKSVWQPGKKGGVS